MFYRGCSNCPADGSITLHDLGWISSRAFTNPRSPVWEEPPHLQQCIRGILVSTIMDPFLRTVRVHPTGQQFACVRQERVTITGFARRLDSLKKNIKELFDCKTKAFFFSKHRDIHSVLTQGTGNSSPLSSGTPLTKLLSLL